jgi:hypothetical protein
MGNSAAPPTGREKHGWDAIPGLRSACPGLFSYLPSGKAAVAGPVRRPKKSWFDNQDHSCVALGGLVEMPVWGATFAKMSEVNPQGRLLKISNLSYYLETLQVRQALA